MIPPKRAIVAFVLFLSGCAISSPAFADRSIELFLQLGHTIWVTSVAFSPDGEWLASGSGDQTVKLWEVGSGELVRTLSASSMALALSPDGKRRASGSGDQAIPMEVAKKFFARAGFQRVEAVPRHVLLLHPKDDQMAGIVTLWQEGQSDPSEPLLATIRKQSDKRVGDIRLYAVYRSRGPSSSIIHSWRGRLACEIIPLLSNILQKALSTDDCERVLKELEEPYLARLDPYAESKPIHDPTWFYGRDELLKRLPAVLAQGQHIGIFGLRKVGKTSLINQLRQRFVSTPTVFIDCQAFSPRAEIYFEEILKQLQAELRSHDVKGIPGGRSISSVENFRQQFLTFYDLWEKTGQRGPFLIILDEIDKLFPNLGGRRCGKTSLLMQIERDLQSQGLAPFTPLPRFLDVQGLDRLTPGLLFETIYHLVIQELEAKPWVPGESGREYHDFLEHLDAAKPMLDQRSGSDWLVILLIDELDASIAKLSDDQFFQNLRNFSMISRFHRHFRLVASGVKEMSDLISSGSSPLNHLRNRHLGILTGTQVRQLIAVGFSDALAPEVESFLFQLTGRHPYLLQGVLENLWEDQAELDKRAVRRAAREFLNQQRTFHH